MMTAEEGKAYARRFVRRRLAFDAAVEQMDGLTATKVLTLVRMLCEGMEPTERNKLKEMFAAGQFGEDDGEDPDLSAPLPRSAMDSALHQRFPDAARIGSDYGSYPTSPSARRPQPTSAQRDSFAERFPDAARIGEG